MVDSRGKAALPLSFHLAVLIGVRGGPNGLCHSCACVRVAGVVGLILGSAGRVGFVVVVRYPLVAVFVGVRFGTGVQGKNALLSEIYVLAGSETSRPKVSCRKRTQKL